MNDAEAQALREQNAQLQAQLAAATAAQNAARFTARIAELNTVFAARGIAAITEATGAVYKDISDDQFKVFVAQFSAVPVIKPAQQDSHLFTGQFTPVRTAAPENNGETPFLKFAAQRAARLKGKPLAENASF